MGNLRKTHVRISCLQILQPTTLPDTNSSHLKMGRAPKETSISIFRCYVSFGEGISSHPITNRFQVPKMEDSLNLVILGVGGNSLHKPYPYSLYRWEFFHFKYLKMFGDPKVSSVFWASPNSVRTPMDLGRGEFFDDVWIGESK